MLCLGLVSSPWALAGAPLVTGPRQAGLEEALLPSLLHPVWLGWKQREPGCNWLYNIIVFAQSPSLEAERF